MQNLYDEETVFDQDQDQATGKARKKSSGEVQTLSVDFDALLPHIGEMGRYQVDTCLLQGETLQDKKYLTCCDSFIKKNLNFQIYLLITHSLLPGHYY